VPNDDDGWLALLLVWKMLVWSLGPEIDGFPYFVSLPFQSAVPPVRPQSHFSHPLQFFIYSSITRPPADNSLGDSYHKLHYTV